MSSGRVIFKWEFVCPSCGDKRHNHNMGNTFLDRQTLVCKKCGQTNIYTKGVDFIIVDDENE